MREIAAVRDGDITMLYPDMFPEGLDRSVAANFIDIAARDLAELISPLPTLSCAGDNSPAQAAKERASKKTDIGLHYWSTSDLETNMTTAADQYITYGFLPMVVEPDLEERTPIIRMDDPMGAYYALDRRGRCIAYAKVTKGRAEELADLFPEAAPRILAAARATHAGGVLLNPSAASDVELEVVFYVDDDTYTLFLPERQNEVLVQFDNPMGVCPVAIAERPGLRRDPRGQFNDAIPIQMARAKMGLLALEAADKAVQAPLVAPDDVQDIPIGPDAIIYTKDPNGVKRVGLEISPSVFAESQNLENELRVGTRYPEGRSGQADASVITGRGIQALLGTIDTQIKTAQKQLGATLAKATRLAFRLDRTLWPSLRKTVRGVMNGQPFTVTYTPGEDIGDDYECDVTYGFAAGLGPQQALVYLLQLRGDRLIGRHSARRHLALNEDPVKLQQEVYTEDMRDALMQGVMAYVQSLPVVVQQGMDPGEVLTRAAKIVDGIERGKSPEDVVQAAFAPPKPPPGSPALPSEQGVGPAIGGSEGDGIPPGMSASGLPSGVAPGQAGMPPGGQPDLMSLLAGLTASGKPDLRAGVSRRLPI